MIDYKLAKQLKDAGFPLKTWCPAIGLEEHPLDNCDGFPALSELIKSCEDKFWKLEYRPHINPANNHWLAAFLNIKGLIRIAVEGKTPDEAVAKLWLKLNPPN